MPWRALRRRFRLIRYYSAPQLQSGFRRTLPATVFASLLLALPATWVSDRQVERTAVVIERDGWLVREPDGTLTALLRGRTVVGRWPAGDVLGSFQLRVEDHRRGWPFASTFQGPVSRLSVESDGGPDVAGDPRLKGEIERALDEAGEDEALVAWQDPAPEPRAHLLGWVANSMVWWLILSVVSALLVATTMLGAVVYERKRAGTRSARQSEGRCGHCGYDLVGLDFSARCPECGTIAD